MEYRWETTRSVVITKGELTEEQEKALLKDYDIRFIGYGEPPAKAYSLFWFTEANTAWDALQASAARLSEALRPYDLDYFTYHTTASAHREKIMQVRMP
jgi:hypothetical protein